MEFIFVVNDLDLGSEKFSGEEIVNELLNREIWVYSSHTPNLKKITKGSKVIIYLAGKGNRAFIGSFEISGDIIEHKIEDRNNALLKIFKLSTPITNINWFKKRVPITDIKNSLDFIGDKKNYGLYFRQSTKVINSKDYNIIISSATK